MLNIRLRIINSFNSSEIEELLTVRRMLQHDKLRKNRVVIVSDDPYLLLLVFTALIENLGIDISIVNPGEGKNEVQRLMYVIDPDFIVFTDKKLSDSILHYGKVLIDRDNINMFNFSTGSDKIADDTVCNFTLREYTPFPTRIHCITSKHLEAMVDSFVQDIVSNELNTTFIKSITGFIPFIGDATDHFIYLISLKLAYSQYLLPGYNVIEKLMDDPSIPVLYITQERFKKLWDEVISSVFENKFLFRLYLKGKWTANILVRNKLRKLLKNYKKVVIIGMLENAYMIDVLMSVHAIKFYSVFPIGNAFQYGSISNSLDSVIATSTPCKQVVVSESKTINFLSKETKLNTLGFKLSASTELYSVNIVTDPSSQFIEGKPIKTSDGILKKYSYLGNINNSFIYRGYYIFPEALERVINSHPFVRYCALTIFQNKLLLLVVPHENILDANKINYGMFNNIMQEHVKLLNKSLPDSYQIDKLILCTSNRIRLDRNGNIMRIPA